MIELGKKQTLQVVKTVDFGVYLGNDEERVPEYKLGFYW